VAFALGFGARGLTASRLETVAQTPELREKIVRVEVPVERERVVERTVSVPVVKTRVVNRYLPQESSRAAGSKPALGYGAQTTVLQAGVIVAKAPAPPGLPQVQRRESLRLLTLARQKLDATTATATGLGALLARGLLSVPACGQQATPRPPARLTSSSLIPDTMCTVMVSGKVTGPDDKPAGGVRVGVGGRPNSENWPTLDSILTAKTADDGTFRVQFEGSAYRPMLSVWARDDERKLVGACVVRLFPAVKRAGAPQADGNEAAPLAAKDVEIRLARAAYIRTSVVDAQGAPVGKIGALVSLVGAYGWTLAGPQSDDHGGLLIGPLPAGVSLRVQPPYEIRHITHNSAWENGLAIMLHPGETYELPALRVDPNGRTVKGVVVDTDGKPVAGGKLGLCRWLTLAPPAVADEQGRFTLYRLSVGQNDEWVVAAHPTLARYAMLQLKPGVGDDLRIVLRPAVRVSGYLADRDGQPLKDAKVRVRPLLVRSRQGSVISFVPWDAPWIPAPPATTTGADGSWTIGGLVAGGGYTVEAERYTIGFDEALFTTNADGTPLDLGMVIPIAAVGRAESTIRMTGE
jgi:hypothetical protein